MYKLLLFAKGKKKLYLIQEAFKDIIAFYEIFIKVQLKKLYTSTKKVDCDNMARYAIKSSTHSDKEICEFKQKSI